MEDMIKGETAAVEEAVEAAAEKVKTALTGVVSHQALLWGYTELARLSKEFSGTLPPWFPATFEAFMEVFE